MNDSMYAEVSPLRQRPADTDHRPVKPEEQWAGQGVEVESEARYRHTLDTMLEGCQIIGFDWRYLYLNDTAVRHSRQTRQDLIGHTMMDVYPGIATTELFSVLQRCMDERAAQLFENEFPYPDGSTGWFELSVQPSPEGLFILSVDISERKKAEARLRKLNRVYAVLSDINQAVVRLSVRDQWPGISPEEQEILFQPFSRGQARSATGEGGTGLGLMIVKRIVEGHGGAVKVESRLGRGCTFTVRIPLEARP